jgi:RNA polymerase sigma-70 factor (ECF subfamily)
MSQVIENKLMDILKLKERQKRKTIYQSISLDELLSHINEEECSNHVISDDESFKAVLTSDINLILLKALEKLSRRQQELCRLLQEEGLNMTQVSEKLNIPRGTLFDEILRIREIFRNEGLKDYLQ